MNYSRFDCCRLLFCADAVRGVNLCSVGPDAAENRDTVGATPAVADSGHIVHRYWPIPTVQPPKELQLYVQMLSSDYYYRHYGVYELCEAAGEEPDSKKSVLNFVCYTASEPETQYVFCIVHHPRAWNTGAKQPRKCIPVLRLDRLSAYILVMRRKLQSPRQNCKRHSLYFLAITHFACANLRETVRWDQLSC